MGWDTSSINSDKSKCNCSITRYAHNYYEQEIKTEKDLEMYI